MWHERLRSLCRQVEAESLSLGGRDLATQNPQTHCHTVWLLLPPSAISGLFHRAIMMSGSAFSDWALVEDPVHYAVKLAGGLNCSIPRQVFWPQRSSDLSPSSLNVWREGRDNCADFPFLFEFPPFFLQEHGQRPREDFKVPAWQKSRGVDTVPIWNAILSHRHGTVEGRRSDSIRFWHPGTLHPRSKESPRQQISGDYLCYSIRPIFANHVETYQTPGSILSTKGKDKSRLTLWAPLPLFEAAWKEGGDDLTWEIYEVEN